MDCRPPYSNKNMYIIMGIGYFIKWVEAISTFNNTVAIVALFLFNHVIARFGVPKHVVSNLGQHFEYEIRCDLSSLLGFEHQYSSSYYPQGNGQIETVNIFFKLCFHGW